MKKEEFKKLKRGNIIRNLCTGNTYIVDSNFGDFIVGVSSLHISNPSEWESNRYR